MDKVNPLLAAVAARVQHDKFVREAFEKWFELASSSINPLMTPEDARAVFMAGFELGQASSMHNVFGSIVTMMKESTERQRDR